MTFKTNKHNVFIHLHKKFKRGVCNFLRNLGMDTAYSVSSMVLYLVFFSCLATIAVTQWKIYDQLIKSLHSEGHVKIVEHVLAL